MKIWEQKANINTEEWASAVNRTKVLGGLYSQELSEVSMYFRSDAQCNIYILMFYFLPS
jgi:hypothetical protein